MTPTEDRLALRRNGYHPLPLEGKRPSLEEWQQKLNINDEEIRFWDTVWCWADNTGVNAKLTPGLDIDILDPAAAEAVETLAREHFGERGDFMVRIGLAPKRLIPLRTDEPFAKLKCTLVAPNGKQHAIEVLGDGQQWVAYGIHPDTGQPYRRHGGEPATTKRGALPYVRLADMQAFIKEAVKLLVDEFQYTIKAASTDEAHQPGEPQASVERITAPLAVIPNNEDWDGWNTIGMAAWRATGGSAAGFVAFDAWSQKSPKYDARNTVAKWAAYFKSPPTDVGAGTIIRRADQASPNWWQGEPPEPELGDPGPAPQPQPQPEPGPEPEPLPCVDLALDLKPREWLVPNRIPMFNVTLLSGEGAIGKSKLALQLSGAVVLGKEWIGMLPAQGPVLYVSCEEDDDELRRQTEDVAVHLGATRQEMAKRGLRPLSFAGKDAILAQPNRHGIMRSTRLFKRIRRDALEQQPKLIVIDTAADTFGGKEIDRAQTRQFITTLRGLAIECGSAVLLIAHPSLTGLKTDSGLSGSTGWHNGPRARLYFKANDDDDDAHPTLRVLEIKKNNYGPVTKAIRVRWKEGVFVTVDPRQQELDLGAGEAAADKLFLTLLRRLTQEGRNVTDKTGTSYAPAIFAQQPEAKNAKVTGKAFAESMQRLFPGGKIRIVTEGPPSRPRTRIVEASTATSTAPSEASTDLPPSSTDLATQPPYNPPLGGSGAVHGGIAPPAATEQEAVHDGSAPRAASGQEGEVRVDEAGLRRVLEAWRAAFGIERTVSIDELVAVEHEALKAALLAVAAMINTNTGAAYPNPTVSNVRLARWLREASGIRLDRLFLQRKGVSSRGSQLWSLRAAAAESTWEEEL